MHYTLPQKKMKRTFPKSNKITKQPPWWDKELQMLKSARYYAYDIFKRTNLEEDKLNMLRAKQAFRNTYRRKYNCYMLKQRDHLLNIRDPNLLWKSIRELKNKDRVDNINHCDWERYFKTLLSAPLDDTTNIEIRKQLEDHDAICLSCRNTEEDDILNGPITANEVKQSIKALPKNKAPGMDGIGMDLISNAENVVIPILTQIFNKILDTGFFPHEWSKAIICPIYKKGPKDNPENYRGISLLNASNKIFAKILNNRLQQWCESADLLHEEQAGFRPGYSTIDNIFNIMAIVQKYLTKPRGRIYIAFVDFSKAFDSIIHDHLWVSLLNNGIHGKFMNVIRSMYNSLLSCVKTQDGLTTMFPCGLGTRQGCILSPLLFVLFLNQFITQLKEKNLPGIQISQEFPSIQALFYADDLSQLGDTVNRLQIQLNELSSFCTNWGMQVNINKTKIMVFRRGGVVRKVEKWYYKGEPLEIVTYFKYMGLLYSNRLIWSAAKRNLAQQATKAMSVLMSFIKRQRTLEIKSCLSLFDRMVIPIITYGAEIWGFDMSQQIEQVQFRFCRFLLGLPSKTTSLSVLGELGRLPLYTVYILKCIKYWSKLIHMQDSRLPRSCYNMLLELDISGRTTWATHVKEILYKYGFGHIWINQGAGDHDLFIREFQQRINDTAKQCWHDSTFDKPKLRTYVTFKTDLELEGYLTMQMPFYMRQLLSLLRCGDLRLNIETGRHHNIDKDQRICQLCHLDVEDEYHFIMSCSKLEKLRQLHIQNETEPKNTHTFIKLMKCTNIIICGKLFLFITEAMKVRKYLTEK